MGYKSYNVKSKILTNCTNFVLDAGDDFFFVIPTNKVNKGDIILVNGKPKCVIDFDKTKITVINYEDSTIDTILPERHVFMGSTYFYGKIISMFGDMNEKKKNNGAIFKYMMMSQMFKQQTDSANGNSITNNMLPLLMMSDAGNMFDGLFNFDDIDLSLDEDDDSEEELNKEDE